MWKARALEKAFRKDLEEELEVDESGEGEEEEGEEEVDEKA